MLCQDAATAAPVLSVSLGNASVSPAWRRGKPNHVEREVQVTNFGLSSRNGLAHSSATSLMRFYTTGSSESAGLRSCFSLPDTKYMSDTSSSGASGRPRAECTAPSRAPSRRR